MPTRYGNEGKGYTREKHEQNLKYFGSNPDAYRQELERVNSVIRNRHEAGMDNTAQYRYLEQLQAVQPYNYQPEYTPPVQNVDFDKYRTETATIEDLQRKYGFDYSREYAQRQAEAERQARQHGIEHQQRSVDSNVEGAAEALDHNYFQRYMQQAQNQVNSGLNAGIASDQDLRLAMSRQANLGDIYRDANLEHQRLADELGRLEMEALAREDYLFNERLQQAFQNSLALTDSDRANNQQMIDALLTQRGMNLDQYNRDRQFRLDEGALTGSYLSDRAHSDIMELMDLKRRAESSTDREEVRRLSGLADNIRQRLALQGVDSSLIGANVSLEEMTNNLGRLGLSTIDRQRLEQQDRQSNTEQAWREYVFNNMSATEAEQFRLAWEQLDWAKSQFNSEQAWRQYVYNNMSAADRARLDENARQFDESIAWQMEEFDLVNQLVLEQSKSGGNVSTTPTFYNSVLEILGGSGN